MRSWSHVLLSFVARQGASVSKPLLHARDLSGLAKFGLIIAASAVFTALLAGLRHAVARSSRTDALLDGPAIASSSRTAARWRAPALLVIGFFPLACCVTVGEWFESVLMAMCCMHWGCMLILPACYYTMRSFEEPDGDAETPIFFKALLVEQSQNLGWKNLRGTLLGVGIFLTFIGGFLVASCKTGPWFGFCIRSFEPPLEDYGFNKHTFTYRIVFALYFTFLNPFFEEFFWRTFLHRELMLVQLGFADPDPIPGNTDRDESKTSDKAPEVHPLAEGNPWKQLLSGMRSIAQWDLSVAAFVRWGVCFMYASYHTWPMKVVFRSGWMLYTSLGFLFLVLLGRFFLLLRETPPFGLAAATILHIWVDAAFAVICLFVEDLHPNA